MIKARVRLEAGVAVGVALGAKLEGGVWGRSRGRA